jgi:hypothetical protein
MRNVWLPLAATIGSLAILFSSAAVLADDSANAARVKQWEPQFQQVWQQSPCARAETWDEYWSWAQKFFLGNFLDPGWFADMAPLSANLSSDNERATINGELEALGRKVASEWAKPNSCRKIDTTMLQVWGRDLGAAAARDSGDGHEIQKQIDIVTQQVNVDLASQSTTNSH